MAERRIETDHRTTPLMCVALIAGVLAGAGMADALYRSMRRRRLEEDRREQLRRWESEGGAIGARASAPSS